VFRAGFVEPVDHREQRADVLLGQLKGSLGCLGWNQTSSGRTATVDHDQVSLPQGSFSSGAHRTHDIARSPTAWAARLVRAVSLPRTNFPARSAGEETNLYPKLDLRWKNVTGGPGKPPPPKGASATPAPPPPQAGGGDPSHIPPGKFKIEKSTPPMA